MKKKTLGIILISVIVAAEILLLLLFGLPVLRMTQESGAFERYISNFGVFGPVIFILMVILQVMSAIIPGGIFEVAGGFAFGTLWGSLLFEIGITLGGSFVFLFSRKFGTKFVGLFLSDEKMEMNRISVSSRKDKILLALFYLIPGTPKDILNYMVALTDLKYPAFLFILSICRIPSTVISVASGTILSSRQYVFFALFTLACIAMSIGGSLYYRKHRARQRGNSDG